MKSTSWENISDTYIKSVGSEGSFYHKNVVIPNTLRLLNINSSSRVLDLACGQGILERHIPIDISYLGLEISESLLKYATENKVSDKHTFVQADVTKKLDLKEKYSHAAMVLAIQNTKDMTAVIKNAHDSLLTEGKFCIVLNHPFFRIPKYSSWEIDLENETQSRRVTKYLSTEEISLLANPGKGDKSEKIYSYHRALQEYSKTLYNTGFVILKIEEWISNKTSVGKHATMENEARKEFPLFMALLCQKI